jgi:hypothetical protein
VEDQSPEPKPLSRQQPYDTTLKDWISKQAAAILPLLLPGASYETTLNVELIRQSVSSGL